jgi:choline-glycine betaine transporter
MGINIGVCIAIIIGMTIVVYVASITSINKGVKKASNVALSRGFFL